MTTVPSFAADSLDHDALASAYQESGFLVLRGVFDAAAVAALQAETEAICSGARGQLTGADLVAAGTPEAALAQVLAVHFPHKVSEPMRQTLFEPRIVAALRTLIGPDIKCMQSMLFVKNAGKPGQAWHQDEHYIPTRDASLTGIWIALDDARIDNGGLWMHPGSHKDRVLWRTHAHGDPRFDSSEEATGFPYEREGGVPVDADAGDVVLFHGYVLHRSLNNTREHGYRRAIVNHVMNARSLLPWSLGFPPQQRADFRDFELVAGEDPYAWKGKEEITKPFLRPEDPAQAAKLFTQLMATDPE